MKEVFLKTGQQPSGWEQSPLAQPEDHSDPPPSLLGSLGFQNLFYTAPAIQTSPEGLEGHGPASSLTLTTIV